MPTNFGTRLASLIVMFWSKSKSPVCVECGKTGTIAWAKRGKKIAYVCEHCYGQLGYAEYIKPGMRGD